MKVSTGCVGAVCLLWIALQPAMAAPVEHHVHIVDQAFSPVEILVQPGDGITWDNHDPLIHTVTHLPCQLGGGPCAFDSGLLDPDGVFASTFATAGTFEYICTTHGFGGLIVVDDPLLAPDLVISELDISDVPIQPLAPAPKKEIVATLANVGDEPALTSTVTIAYRVGDETRVLKTQEVNALHPGDTARVLARWTTTGHVGDFPVTATADALASVVESAEENNEETVIVSLITPPGVLPGVDVLDPA